MPEAPTRTDQIVDAIGTTALALNKIAEAIRGLETGSGSDIDMGRAIRDLSHAIKEGSSGIADGLRDIADAISDHGRGESA